MILIISAKDICDCIWKADHNVTNNEIHFYLHIKATLVHYDTKCMTIDAWPGLLLQTAFLMLSNYEGASHGLCVS